jgi:DNA-binding response OmpR family regulator
VKALLVEDHEESRNTLSLLLARCGHATITAGTAAEAMAILLEKRVDVLICDLGLPDGDGLEVVVRAKQLNPDVKAIALTARDSDDDYEVGFLAGFDHYMTKPFDFGELRSLLAR